MVDPYNDNNLIYSNGTVIYTIDLTTYDMKTLFGDESESETNDSSYAYLPFQLISDLAPGPDDSSNIWVSDYELGCIFSVNLESIEIEEELGNCTGYSSNLYQIHSLAKDPNTASVYYAYVESDQQIKRLYVNETNATLGLDDEFSQNNLDSFWIDLVFDPLGKRIYFLLINNSITWWEPATSQSGMYEETRISDTNDLTRRYAGPLTFVNETLIVTADLVNGAVIVYDLNSNTASSRCLDTSPVTEESNECNDEPNAIAVHPTDSNIIFITGVHLYALSLTGRSYTHYVAAYYTVFNSL